MIFVKCYGFNFFYVENIVLLNNYMLMKIIYNYFFFFFWNYFNLKFLLKFLVFILIDC